MRVRGNPLIKGTFWLWIRQLEGGWNRWRNRAVRDRLQHSERGAEQTTEL